MAFVGWGGGSSEGEGAAHQGIYWEVCPGPGRGSFVFGADEVLGRFELTFFVGLAHIVLRVIIAHIPRWVIGIHSQRYLVVPVVVLLAYHSL